MTSQPIDDTTETQTEPETRAEPPESPVELPSPPHPPHLPPEPIPEGAATPEAEDTEEDTPSAREAARYRTRLREAEATNTALAQQITALQTQLVEGQCAAYGVKAAAVFAVAELGDLVGADGTVDPALVATAIRHAQDELGLRGIGLDIPGEGFAPAAPGGPATWDSAFQPKVSR